MSNLSKIFSLFSFFLTMVVGPLCAEFQTFKNSSGGSIEAELIKLSEEGDSVYIRLRSGNKMNADLSAFSSEDQTKIKDWWKQVQADKELLNSESRLVISAKMNRKSKGDLYHGYSRVDDTTKSFFPEVVIKNDDLEAYKDNTVHIIVIAKDLRAPDQRLVVSSSVLESDFKDRSDTVLHSDPFKLRLYEYDSSYSSNDYAYGYEYEGYAVIIKNSKGEITHTRATKAKYLSNMKLILECKAGEMYDDSMDRKLKVSPSSYYVQ